jgi:hypothetical protein
MNTKIRKFQKGFSTISLSMAVTAAALISLGSANYMMNKAKYDVGNTVGTQVQNVTTAMTRYVLANGVAIVGTASVPGVSNKFSPTIAELKSLGHLPSIINNTPTLGGAYQINISKSPFGCVSPGCTLTGTVQLQDPVIGPSGNASDIKLLSSAALASPTGLVGFSSATNPSLVKAASWQHQNLDPAQRAGIVMGLQVFTQSSAGSNFTDGSSASSSSSSSAEKWWLEPVDTLVALNALPVASNVAGDIRTVKETGKPYMWVAAVGATPAAWRDLNTTSFGTYSAGKNSSKLGFEGIYIGENAGPQTIASGQRTIAIGYGAASDSSPAYGNTIIGVNAGRFASGGFNIFTGEDAGRSSSGYHNAIYGNSAFYSMTGGGNNTGAGSFSGYNLQNGFSNSFYGRNSGIGNGAGGIINGSNNTAIGAFTGFNGDYSNATAIGYQAFAVANNSVRLGNSSVTLIGGQVGWSNMSDKRLKEDIKTSERGLDFINKLTPVDYTLISSKKPSTGFIAQDVEAIDKNFPGVNKPASEKDFYSISYTDFIPSIVKSIQQLDAKIAGSGAALSKAAEQEIQSLKTTVNLLAMGLIALFALVVWLMREVFTLKSKFAKLQGA